MVLEMPSSTQRRPWRSILGLTIALTTSVACTPWHALDLVEERLGRTVLPQHLADFGAALQIFRSITISQRQYERPPPRSDANTPSTLSLGGMFVRAVAQRNNPVEDGPLLHVQHSLRHITRLPEMLQRGDMRDADVLRDVFNHMLAADDLRADRAARCIAWDECTARLAPFTAWVRAAMCGPAGKASGHMSVPMVALCTEGLRWPDTALAACVCAGFPSVGDIPDSGVFRPCERPAAYSVEELAQGRARAADGRRQLPSNSHWISELTASITRRARSAGSEGPAAEALQAIERSVIKEMDGSPPTMGDIMTPSSFLRYVQRQWPGQRPRVRPIRSFARKQGVRKDGSVKWRRIDDCKEAGQNDCAALHETVFHVSFEWPAHASALLQEVAESLGIPPSAIPALGLALEDMSGAYRQLFNRDGDWTGIICFWYSGATDGGQLGAPGVRFARVYGHVFGSAPSVLNFERYARMITRTLQVFFGVAAANYVDDQCAIDFLNAGDSARRCIWQLHHGLGSRLDRDKSLLLAASNVFLGVRVSLQHVFTRGYASCEATRERCDGILASLHQCRERGRLEEGDISRLRGKLGFCSRSSAYRVGRAAFGALRRHSARSSSEWTRDLDMLFAFLDVVLRALPALLVFMRRDERRPVHLYTDASYERRGGRPRDGDGVIAVVLVDPSARAGDPAMRVAMLAVPSWIWQKLAPDRETHILQAELLAMVAAYWTFPEQLAGRPIYHWCDNTGALAAATGGGAARFPGADLLTCMLHLILLGLQCQVYFDWVPSKANIADWPTRSDTIDLIPDWAIWRELRLPARHFFSSLGDPKALRDWASILGLRRGEA